MQIAMIFCFGRSFLIFAIKNYGKKFYGTGPRFDFATIVFPELFETVENEMSSSYSIIFWREKERLNCLYW